MQGTLSSNATLHALLLIPKNARASSQSTEKYELLSKKYSHDENATSLPTYGGTLSFTSHVES